MKIPNAASTPTNPPSASNPVLLKLPGDPPFELTLKDLDKQAQAELKKLEKAASDVEGIFVKDLMTRLAPKSSFGEGQMGDFIRDQFLNAISETVGKSGALGIGKMLRNNLQDSLLRKEASKLILGNENKP